MKSIVNIISICLITLTSYSQNSEIVNFAIENIDGVDKIVITEKNGVVFTLVKGAEQWNDDKGNCIIQENVDLILDAFANIEFDGFLSDKIVQQYSNRDSITRVKIDIYEHNQYLKTWYIGPPSNDRNGQIMFLKTKYSTGELPVVTKVKGLVGIIEPRFFSDNKKWKCTTIFAISPEEIASVIVTHTENKKKSFRVDISNEAIQVIIDTTRLSIIDTASVYRYLGKFRNVQFERFDDQLNSNQIDSLKATTPFLKLEVIDKNGTSKSLYGYRKKSDENRFWCMLFPYEEFVTCQYFSFNTLITSEYYFQLADENEK